MQFITSILHTITTDGSKRMEPLVRCISQYLVGINPEQNLIEIAKHSYCTNKQAIECAFNELRKVGKLVFYRCAHNLKLLLISLNYSGALGSCILYTTLIKTNRHFSIRIASRESTWITDREAEGNFVIRAWFPKGA